MDIVVSGTKGGETKIVLDDGSGFQKKFLNATFVKRALGPPAEQIIEEDSNTAQEQRQRLEEAEVEREKEAQEMQDLKSKIERTKANIDANQEEQGSNLQSEAELKKKLSNRT